jgi:hypothetical protein
MKNLLLKWSLPVLVLVVIGAQFFMVYRHRLTRWKGGGFGMYSQIHPIDKRVWIVTRDSSWSVHEKNSTLGKMAHTLRFYPNHKKLQQFARKVASTYRIEVFAVEIWEPHLNPKSNTLARKLTARIEYPLD